MQFTFSKKYKFDCKQCGACCFPRALSLTDAEYNRLAKTVDRSDYDVREFYVSNIRLHDVSLKKEDCCFLGNVDSKRICKIYDTRFIACRLFPLSISTLPSGELLVNLIRCNGVSLDQGRPVDESFVKDVLDDINRLDSSYIQEFITDRKSHNEDLLPFFTRYDLTEFSAKKNFLGKF